MDKTLHMSIAFGRVSSQQFWEAIREQLQVRTMAQPLADSCATVHPHTVCIVLQHVCLHDAGCSWVLRALGLWLHRHP